MSLYLLLLLLLLLLLRCGLHWVANHARTSPFKHYSTGALGVDFRTRGARTDEALEFLRCLWQRTEPISFAGKYFKVSDMHIHPGAGERPSPPIWVGGNGRAALRRTAHYGDVWHPILYGTSPRRVAEGLAEVRRQASELGRDATFSAALHARPQLTDEVGEVPWETGRIKGPLDHVRMVLDEYHEAGVSHIILSFGGSPERRIDLMQRLAAELLTD